MKEQIISKIAVIGNAGGGKTTLSRKLAALHRLPTTHVDSIQFVAGMQIRPLSETRRILNDVQAQSQWLIDGYGPLDQIEKRLREADRIILIDFPVWRHYWWCVKRQIKSFFVRRRELPEGCNEATFAHTLKLFKTIGKVHRQMRPELLRILSRPELSKKLLHIQSLQEWRKAYREGIS